MHGLHHHAMTYNQFLLTVILHTLAEQYPVGFNTTVKRTEESQMVKPSLLWFRSADDDGGYLTTGAGADIKQCGIVLTITRQKHIG